MGKGNKQKAAMKREKNMEKAQGSAGSQLKANEAAKTLQCKICLQTFLCTASTDQLKEHSENKHPKKAFVECFDRA